MIKIISVGKIKEKYLVDLIEDYKTRITKYQKIEIIELKDSNKQKENEEILRVLNEKDFNICMDIKGKKINSEELSELIDTVSPSQTISAPNVFKQSIVARTSSL